MKRFLIIALLAIVRLPAQDLAIASPAFLGSYGMLLTFDLQGPPNTPFGLYYVVGNIFYDPAPQIGELVSGQTDQNGQAGVVLPFQVPFPVTVPEAQFAGVFFPPAAPPIVTEIVSLSLTGGNPLPPPPPCGPAIGSLIYDPETCIVTYRYKACPGDVIELKKNGVVIGSAVASSSGEGAIGLGMQCIGAGQSFTGHVNGVAILGPIRG